MARRKRETIEAYPLRSFRLEKVRSEPAMLLELATEPGGQGHTSAYIVNADTLEKMARDFDECARMLRNTTSKKSKR